MSDIIAVECCREPVDAIYRVYAIDDNREILLQEFLCLSEAKSYAHDMKASYEEVGKVNTNIVVDEFLNESAKTVLEI